MPPNRDIAPRPVPEGLLVNSLHLSATGMDQGWGNTGAAGAAQLGMGRLGWDLISWDSGEVSGNL